MRRFRWYAGVFLVPVLAFLVGTLGCSGDNKGGGGGGTPTHKGGDGTAGGGGGGGGGGGELTAVEAKGMATIKGTVTYDGDPPDPGTVTSRKDFQEHKDKDYCLKGDVKGQSWKVGANKGVADVVIWVKPPAKHYFPVPDDKFWPKEVDIDQPQCQFIPHVLVYFPRDAKGKSSGQTLKIKNSASIAHNTKWAGGEDNPGGNDNLPPGHHKEVPLEPSRTVVTFNCDFHKWMNAYCWVLDTPYYAVTDKDGNFEIKNVPAGAELTLVAWHEDTNQNAAKSPDKNFDLPEGAGSRSGEKIGTLKDGETKTVNFKVKEK